MSKLSVLEKQLVPVIVDKFGSDLVFVKWEHCETSELEVQFASNVLFLSAVFRNETGITKFPLIVKYELSNPLVRQWMKLEEQFYNEVFAYENILPLLDVNSIVNDLFPVYYCGFCSGSSPEDDVIVLEDLKPKGFKMSKEIIRLDYHHCAVALRQLGRYHALSYNAKQNKKLEFFDKIKSLKECRFREDMSEDNYYLFTIASRRAVQPLLDRNECVDIVGRFLDKMEDPANYLSDLVKPEEPLAVICHGDFCRNNILYKYDSNNTPIDARLFDIATSRYASPAIDLSFFLFLNTTHEMRQLHWDDFLRIYHDALVETIPDAVKPSLDDIQQDVRKKAVYGYALCSFFLPALMNDERWNADALCHLPWSQKYAGVAIYGGQKATEMTSTIFKELIEMGCIK